MKIIYYHIGFTRTGNTFLRRKIYVKLKSVNYINQNNTELVTYLEKMYREKLTSNDIHNFNLYLSKYANKEKNLISSEGLAGLTIESNKKDRILILKELKQASKGYKIKIILTLREVVSAITSFYNSYIVNGGTKNLNGFLSDFDYSQLNYSRYTKEITKIFGKNNLHILTYEKLTEQKELRKLMDFLGEKDTPSFKNKRVNRGYGVLQMKLGRLINPFFKLYYNPNGLLPVKRIKIFNKTLILRPRLLLKYSQKLFFRKYNIPEDVAYKIRKEVGIK